MSPGPGTIVTLPLLIPLAGAVLCVLLWGRVAAQRVVAVLTSALLLASSITLAASVAGGEVLAVRLGNWPPPVAITLVADAFAAIMVLLNGIVALAAAIYAFGGVGGERERLGYHPLMLSLFAAVSGAFLTGDLFNLYVWFEVMLLSSFVLLSLGGTRPQLEGALKYVSLNLLSSVLFLSAIGLVYGLVGTLNMADIATKLAASEDRSLFTPVAGLLLVAFAIKGGLFPFFFWLPASYHTPSPVVSGVFAGLLTKVGVYAMIRATGLFVPGDSIDGGVIAEGLVWAAGFTMVTGVLGAAVQQDMRRILSFHIVSQVGYMIIGLAIAGVALDSAAAMAPDSAERDAMLATAGLAMTGAVFYILHHIVVKANLFFVAGIVEKISGTGELNRVGGLYRHRPLLAALFFVPAMSLAGIPILSGFWGKFVLVRAGIEAGTNWLVAASLAVSLMTLFSMTKIWAAVFWSPTKGDTTEDLRVAPLSSFRGVKMMYAACGGMAAVTIAIGVGAGFAVDLAEVAGRQLIEPKPYIEALLGEVPSAEVGAIGGAKGRAQ